MPVHYHRIFLLSHMRAFTSLAGHILGSHPQVNGYYEMQISYEDAATLGRQLAMYQQGDVLKGNSRYIFDKLLHTDFQLRLDQLGINAAKVLVSLRDPAHTIRSIINLFTKKQINDLYASPPEATRYYIERVKSLADYCRQDVHGYYYYDAEMFKKAPDDLLPKLAQWLELDSPLSGKYQIFSHTGMARKGDSSKLIHSGSIDPTSIDYSHIDLSADLLRQAQAVYEECRDQIIRKAKETVTI